MKRESCCHARPGTHGIRLSVLFILLGLWGGVNGLILRVNGLILPLDLHALANAALRPIVDLGEKVLSVFRPIFVKEVTKAETGPPAVKEVTKVKTGLIRLTLNVTLKDGSKVWCTPNNSARAAWIFNEYVPLALQCPEVNDHGGVNCDGNEDGDNRSPITVEKDCMDVVVSKRGNGSKLTIHYEGKEGRVVSTNFGPDVVRIYDKYQLRLDPSGFGALLKIALKKRYQKSKKRICYDTTTTKGLFDCICQKRDDRDGTLQCGVEM